MNLPPKLILLIGLFAGLIVTILVANHLQLGPLQLDSFLSEEKSAVLVASSTQNIKEPEPFLRPSQHPHSAIQSPLHTLSQIGRSVNNATENLLITHYPHYTPVHSRIVALLQHHVSLQQPNPLYSGFNLIENLEQLAIDCQTLSTQQHIYHKQNMTALNQLNSAHKHIKQQKKVTIEKINLEKRRQTVDINPLELSNPQAIDVSDKMKKSIEYSLLSQLKAWGALSREYTTLLQQLKRYSLYNKTLLKILQEANGVLREAMYAMQMQGQGELSEDIIAVLIDLRHLLDSLTQTREQALQTRRQVLTRFRFTRTELDG
jgi:hypothetical protein